MSVSRALSKPSLVAARRPSSITTARTHSHAPRRVDANHHPPTRPSPRIVRERNPPTHRDPRAFDRHPIIHPHPSTTNDGEFPVARARTHRRRWPATRRTRRHRSSPPRARDSSAHSPPRSTCVPRRASSSAEAIRGVSRVRDSFVWVNSVTAVPARPDRARADSRARRHTTPRRWDSMAESQWEHQAKFAGELFVGMSALVGAYLCFMYAHLRHERRARAARRAAATRDERAATRDERARLVGGGGERGGGVV